MMDNPKRVALMENSVVSALPQRTQLFLGPPFHFKSFYEKLFNRRSITSVNDAFIVQSFEVWPLEGASVCAL